MPTFTISSKKPVVVLDMDEYEELRERLEHLDILSSKSLKRDLAAARKALKEGKTSPLEEVMDELIES